MSHFPSFLHHLPEVDLDLPGFSARLLQGDRHQAVFMRFDADVVVPEHSHAAQWEIVIAGEMELDVEGQTRTYRAGESFQLAAGQVHGARVKAGYRAVAFFDQKDRYQQR